MTTEQSQRAREAEHRRVLIRDAVRYSCIAGALACAGIALGGMAELAISVALGTGLGVLNFIFLARGVSAAVERTVVAVDEIQRERGGGEVEPEEIPDRPRGTGGALRLALVVLLLAAMVLLTPIDPVGLAVGVILVLVAASVSAYRHERSR